MELNEGQEAQLAPAEAEQPEPVHQEYSWQASEYIYHEKPTGWYLGLWVVAAVLCGIFGLLRQWLSIGVVVAMALAVVVYSRKQPRTLAYKLDDKGISIEDKVLDYHQFRSYSLYQDIGWISVDLEPARRFVPRLTLICEQDKISQIEPILAAHLPRVDHEPDFIERLSRRLKF